MVEKLKGIKTYSMQVAQYKINIQFKQSLCTPATHHLKVKLRNVHGLEDFILLRWQKSQIGLQIQCNVY